MEKNVLVDGLRIAGTSYFAAEDKEAFIAYIKKLSETASPTVPTILLKHSPKFAPELSSSLVDLMLSGHTHFGQVFPFNLAAKLVYGPYAYGLHTSGKTNVYTTSGANTWGPPMRLGTQGEIILLKLIRAL